MEDKLRQAIKAAVSDYLEADTLIELFYPQPGFGDYSSNVAMKVAAAIGGSARDVAAEVAAKVSSHLGDLIDSAKVAGPGFINFSLSGKGLLLDLERGIAQPLKGQTAVAEFSDPNPFKILHAGHLYTSVVGDAIAHLLAQAGAEVFRVNYGGDVGLHVAKSLWAMLQDLGGEKPEALEEIQPDERSNWMSKMYVDGTAAYESNPKAKAEIDELNKKIYQVQSTNDHDSALARIYWTTRNWSYVAFDAFYSHLNIFFDRVYPESEVAPIGLATVKEQLAKGVFEESDGAVVFRGEQYGLHTRVFINSSGLPTYEAKEIGLAEMKKQDFNFQRSIIITGNEQEQYMEVVLAALKQFAPDLADKTLHLTHGMVRLRGGKKMSSRYGNILRAEDVIEAAAAAAEALGTKRDERVVLAAIKYAFLKQGMGGDIEYDPKDSVSLRGNSGPYLQYAHARARSILKKAGRELKTGELRALSEAERELALKLSRFASYVENSFSELAPHVICGYLFDLCQQFNAFYETNRVIGDERAALRLNLVSIYADRLKRGLELLGIEAPEQL